MSEFTDAIASGNQLRALEAIRDLLATRLEDAPSSTVAPIAAQLRTTIHEIGRPLRPGEPGNAPEVTTVHDPVDELKARRANRLAGAADSPEDAGG